MNDRQRSITAAFGIIVGAFALQNNWLSRLGSWASRAPGQAGGGATPPGAVSLDSWQSAVVLYAILMLVGETDNAGELAVLLAWGVAIGKVLLVAGKVSLKDTKAALSQAGQATPQSEGSTYQYSTLPLIQSQPTTTASSQPTQAVY